MDLNNTSTQPQAPVQPQPQPIPNINPVLQQEQGQIQSQPVTQPQPVVPPTPESNGGKKRLMMLLLVLLLVILGIGGFFAYSYFNSSKTYNAGVYNYPTAAQMSPTPTEAINPTDTTDAALDKDTQTVDQQLNGLNSDITGVDDSVNDKQTNLQ